MVMTYYELENLSKRVDSIYKLILMASRRATEINSGMEKLIDARPTEKPTVTALREILEDKVKIRLNTKKPNVTALREVLEDKVKIKMGTNGKAKAKAKA